MSSPPTPIPTVSPPWWRFGHVWMVISGPAIVVVASCITFYLAASKADPVVDENYYRNGSALSERASPQPGMVPAQQGRNHMATEPAPKPSR